MINGSFRTYFLLFSIIIFTSATESLAQQNEFTTIQPDNPNIRYTGRWNFDNPREPCIVWQGSSILVKFRATAVDRKRTRLNSSHKPYSYAVFFLKKKNTNSYAVLSYKKNI